MKNISNNIEDKKPPIYLGCVTYYNKKTSVGF